MRKPIGIALVGLGGFAQFHYQQIKELEQAGQLSLRAVMVRECDLGQCQDIVATLKAEGTRIYTSMENLLDGEQKRVNLVVIPTGISAHAPMSIAAMEAGYHVLCEKPAAGNVAECLAMQQAQERTGRILAICFQNIFSPAIQRIKKIALDGELGALLTAKTHVLWPRAESYYRRSPWSGKIAFQGVTINDCPLINATAHFFNNMLYVAGSKANQSAYPISVYGENYRTKKIESCDTQFVRVLTDTGTKLLFITSHSCDQRVDPVTEFHFEKGHISWSLDQGTVVQRLSGGRLLEVERIAPGSSKFLAPVYRNVCDAIAYGTEPLAVVQNSLQHVICGESSLLSGPIVDVPPEYLESKQIREDDDCLKVGDNHTFIRDIKPLFERMHNEEIGFHEAGCPWAIKSSTILPELHFPEFDFNRSNGRILA